MSAFHASAGTPRRNDTDHWMKTEAIRPRSEGRNTTHTDAHTLVLAVPPGWTTTPKPCDWMEWGQDWDLDLRNIENGDQIAADMCHGCPVLEQCLESAMLEEGTLTARNRYLIRGGLTPAGRAELAKLRTKLANPCAYGHEPNWVERTDGSWRCRTCRNEYERGLRRKRHEEEAA